MKLSAHEGDLVEDTTMYRTHSGEFDLHDHHKAIFELCS